MLPAARWNTRATLRGETVEHEASHACAARLFGFEVGEISLDRLGRLRSPRLDHVPLDRPHRRRREGLEASSEPCLHLVECHERHARTSTSEFMPSPPSRLDSPS